MAISIDYAADFLIILGEVGESITYHPKGGSPRTILAQIERSFTEIANQAGNEYPRNTHQIQVAIDATDGMGATEPDAGSVDSDTVAYKKDPGDAADTTFRVVEKKSGFGRWVLTVME